MRDEDNGVIIFGCGYVGSVVARIARDRGMQVTAVTRNEERATALRVDGLHVIVSDLASKTWHLEAPIRPKWVLNSVSSASPGEAGYRHSYIAGMQSILEWAAATGPIGTFVYTSSTSVYPQDGGVRVSENAPTNEAGALGQVLLEAERLVESATAEQIQKSFILRLAGIYGPGRRHLIDQVELGQVSGRPDSHLNLVHRDDIAAAIWAAFEAPIDVQGGVFNVADDGGATKGEVVTWLAEQLRLPSPVFTGVPAAARRTVTPDRVIENTKIKHLLGWVPRFPSFREGYKNMLAPGSD